MRLFLILLAIMLIGCHASEPSGQKAGIEITVSAAASLKDAFVEIGRLYEARNGSGVKVNFNFGASGILQKQIEEAAPVDVFASAGAKQLNELQTKGLINEASRRDFARNELVLIAPADASFRPTSFEELDDPKLQHLAIGNPKTVPAGQYTEQLLTNLKLWERLQTRLVFAEDVRQVLDYVARGEAEAGIVYASDVSIAQGQVREVARAPANSHDPVLYSIVVIKASQHTEAAHRFVELVASDEGQSILRKYGFLGEKMNAER